MNENVQNDVRATKSFVKILDKLTAILTEYLELQLKHGADILMIFDTWGGILPYSKYQEFSLDFNQKIITSF